MNTAVTPRPLVMGIIYGMDVSKISVFFESLRATGYDGPIVIFATKISRDMADYLNAKGATIIYKDRHGVRLRTLFAKRYYFYREYLRAHRGEFDLVLTSDIRDVSFQSNPFEQVESSQVHYFEECGSYLIRDEHTNWLWARKIWPPEVRDALAQSKIICAGVQLAGTEEMLAYYDVYIRAFERLPYLLRRKLGGGDQSVHQYVAHVVKKPGGVFVPNNGLVATMGLEQMETYTIDEAGRITVAGGHAPAILHQYDRLPAIRDKLEAIYLPRAAAPASAGA